MPIITGHVRVILLADFMLDELVLSRVRYENKKKSIPT
jgi:hypothetical protein